MHSYFYEQMQYFVQRNKNAFIYKINNANDIASLSEIVGSLERLKLIHKEGHREFFNMLRNDDASDSGVKLSSYSSSEQMGYSMIRDSKVATLLSKWNKGDVLKQLFGASVQSASCVLVFALKEVNRTGLIDAGKLLEQLWIAANGL